MSRFSYHAFVGSFCTVVGIGLVGTILWLQNGGLVSDITPLRHGVSLPQITQDDVPTSTVEELPLYIEVPEVIIKADQQPVKHRHRQKRLYQCREHQLEQGGRVEEPSVNMCEWILLP